MDIDSSFLLEDPVHWPENEIYKEARQRVCALQVVNDVAERAVKLATDFNGRMTKDAQQEEFLLQVIEYHRQLKPLRH